MLSLRLGAAFRMEPLRPRLVVPWLLSTSCGSGPLLDIIYIALGLGAFALFGAFAAALRRL